MQEIFSLIKANWELITGIICLIISVIVSIIRKRPVNDIFSYLYPFCIEAVSTVEKSSILGADQKLNAGISYVVERLRVTFPGIRAEKYLEIIASIIEAILSTPQKKGE